MKAPYFIETLARNGEVLHRQRVAGLPIRLGRGYDNDFVLDDAHSAAQHALVEAYSDGHLMLRDLGSQNGTIYQGKRHSTVILGGDTVVRLGHTNLRIRGADYAVAPELVDTTMHGWEGTRPALSGLALVAATATLGKWIGDSQAFQLINYLLVIAYALGGALVWAAIWAFGNRLFDRHARLGRHLFVVGCGLAAVAVWQTLSNTLAYAWSLEWLTRYGSHALIALLCGMIYFHLRTIKPRHWRGMVRACLILMALGSGLTLLSNVQRTGRLSDELYMAVILPPAVRQSPDHSPEQFFSAAAALKAEADADRAKGLKDGDHGDDADGEEDEEEQ